MEPAALRKKLTLNDPRKLNFAGPAESGLFWLGGRHIILFCASMGGRLGVAGDLPFFAPGFNFIHSQSFVCASA